MPTILVTALTPSTISQSETDTVSFVGGGTLNIAGTTSSPINVVLSSIVGTGVGATVNITNAAVQLNGLVNASALVNYNIGNGGTLTLGSTANIGVGSTIAFTGQTGKLAIANGLTIAALDPIDGFGPGKTIDLAGRTITGLTYTDAAGANTGGTLSLTDSNNNTTTLTLGSGDFSAANFSTGTDGAAGTLISFASAVTGTTATPASGTLGPNATATLHVALSNPVTVTGTPTLLLNDGGTATYDAAASTPTNLAFNYTVLPGQNTSNLAITGVAMNGGLLSTVNGALASLTSAVGSPIGNIAVDTLAPVISAATATAASGVAGAPLGVGSLANIVLTPSEAVALTGGTPTLTLNDGGTATYNAAASTPTSLVFTTTVAAGQNAAPLQVTGTNLNGATLTDLAGNALNLASAAGTPVGNLVVDTLAPLVNTATLVPTGTSSTSTTLGLGSTANIVLTTSEPISVTGGTPSLALNDGGTATFNPTASTPTSLVFGTTVAAGQNAASLAVTSTALNGATLTDLAGNVLSLVPAVGSLLGSLPVDTTVPAISSVVTNPASGTLGVGQVITLTATPSEAVTVTGTPTLALSDGGTATFDPTSSTATQLVFHSTVQSGQNTPDLAVLGSSLNGATLTDAAGNALDMAGFITNPVGTLVVDTVAPVITAVTTDPGSGTLGVGGTVHFNVALDSPVQVTGGTPTLALSDGGTATFDAAVSTPTMLVFDHTVASGQNTADLSVTGASTAGATIADAAGNALNLQSAIGNPAGTLTINTATVQVPTTTLTAPTVVSVTTQPGSGNLTTGDTVGITVTTDHGVTVSGGTPTLVLSDGGLATYDPTSSTPTSLMFHNTVTAGQTTSDLAVVGFSMNGSTIADSNGLSLPLTGAEVNPAGILSVGLGTTTTGGGGTTTTGGGGTTTTGGGGTTTTGGGGTTTTGSGGTTTTGGGGTTTTGSGGTTTTGSTTTGGTTTTSGGTNTGGSTISTGSNSNTGGASTTGATGTTTAANGTDTSYATIPIYRFFETSNGTHFYTPDAQERDSIVANRPDLISEGIGLYALAPNSGDPNAVAVYRFFDKVHGTQFLTASASERDNVIANRADLVYEPAGTFYEHTTAQTGDTAVYRFFSSKDGTHFYTDSATERASILQTRPDLISEGVGFYEPKHT